MSLVSRKSTLAFSSPVAFGDDRDIVTGRYEGVLFDVVDLPNFVAGAIQTSVVALGMIVILYSLHGSIPSESER